MLFDSRKLILFFVVGVIVAAVSSPFLGGQILLASLWSFLVGAALEWRNSSKNRVEFSEGYPLVAWLGGSVVEFILVYNKLY
jgi:hypothetical protein